MRERFRIEYAFSPFRLLRKTVQPGYMLSEPSGSIIAYYTHNHAYQSQKPHKSKIGGKQPGQAYRVRYGTADYIPLALFCRIEVGIVCQFAVAAYIESLSLTDSVGNFFPTQVVRRCQHSRLDLSGSFVRQSIVVGDTPHVVYHTYPQTAERV